MSDCAGPELALPTQSAANYVVKDTEGPGPGQYDGDSQGGDSPDPETEEEKRKRLETEAQIRAALNQQTIIQYRQYAQEQHPKEPHKQEELIRQLQEQHFHQYMTHVYKQQVVHQRQQLDQLLAIREQQQMAPEPDGEQPAVQEPLGEEENGTGGEVALPPLVPASLWTRKDIAEFKQEILKTQRECCIKIGSLATATVRVPTHEEGTCIFWEFATDYYDLGFGVYFEWSLTPSDKITVHVSESSDEEELDEEEEEAVAVSASGAAGEKTPGSLEAAPGVAAGVGGLADVERGRKRDHRPPTDELIPVYRRDCHEEVYCGSHQYPGRGVYVLKFDNSYSLWRSKWLYYRVYYTR